MSAMPLHDNRTFNSEGVGWSMSLGDVGRVSDGFRITGNAGAVGGSLVYAALALRVGIVMTLWTALLPQFCMAVA